MFSIFPSCTLAPVRPHVAIVSTVPIVTFPSCTVDVAYAACFASCVATLVLAATPVVVILIRVYLRLSEGVPAASARCKLCGTQARTTNKVPQHDRRIFCCTSILRNPHSVHDLHIAAILPYSSSTAGVSCVSWLMVRSKVAADNVHAGSF